MTKKIFLVFVLSFFTFANAFGQADVQAGAINIISNFAGEEIVLQSSDYVFDTRFGKVRVKMSLKDGESIANLVLTPPIDGELGSMSNQAASLVASLASSSNGKNSDAVMEAISAVIQNGVGDKEGSEGDVLLNVSTKPSDIGIGVKVEFTGDDTNIKAEFVVSEKGDGKAEVEGESNVNGNSQGVNVNITTSNGGVSASGSIGDKKVETNNSAKQEGANLQEGKVVTANPDGTSTEVIFKDNGDGSATVEGVKTDKEGNVVGEKEVVTVQNPNNIVGTKPQQSGTLSTGGTTENVESVPESTVVTGTVPRDYSNKDISKQNFSNRVLSNSKFVKTTAIGTNFVGAALDGADFTSANLIGANFSTSVLSNAKFNDAKVINANFSNTTSSGFTREQFYSTDTYKSGVIKGMNLSNNDIGGWSFFGKTVEDVDFFKTNSSRTDGAVFNFANGATLTNVDFSDSNAHSDAVIAGFFSRSELNNVNFDNSTFSIDNLREGYAFTIGGATVNNVTAKNSNFISNVSIDDSVEATGYFSSHAFTMKDAENAAKINGLDLSNSTFTATFKNTYKGWLHGINMPTTEVRDFKAENAVINLELEGVDHANAETLFARGVDASKIVVAEDSSFDISGSKINAKVTNDSTRRTNVYAIYLHEASGGNFDLSDTAYDISVSGKDQVDGVAMVATSVNMADGTTIDMSGTKVELSSKSSSATASVTAKGAVVNGSLSNVDFANSNYNVYGEGSGELVVNGISAGGTFLDDSYFNIDNASITATAKNNEVGETKVYALQLLLKAPNADVNVTNSTFSVSGEGNGGKSNIFTVTGATSNIGENLNFSNNNFYATATGSGEFYVRNIDILNFGANANFSKNNYNIDVNVKDGEAAISSYTFWEKTIPANANFSESKYNINATGDNSNLRIVASQFGKTTIEGELDLSKSEYDIKAVSENNSAYGVALQITTNVTADKINFSNNTINGDIKATDSSAFIGIAGGLEKLNVNELNASNNQYNVKSESSSAHGDAKIINGLSGTIYDLNLSNSNYVIDASGTSSLARAVSAASLHSENADFSGSTYDITTTTTLDAANAYGIQLVDSSVLEKLNASQSNYIFETNSAKNAISYGFCASNLSLYLCDLTGSVYDMKSNAPDGSAYTYGVYLANVGTPLGIDAKNSRYTIDSKAKGISAAYGINAINMNLYHLDLYNSTYNIKSENLGSDDSYATADGLYISGIVDMVTASSSSFVIEANGNRNAIACGAYFAADTSIAISASLSSSNYDIKAGDKFNTNYNTSAIGVEFYKVTAKDLLLEHSTYKLESVSNGISKAYGFYAYGLSAESVDLQESSYESKSISETGHTENNGVSIRSSNINALNLYHSTYNLTAHSKAAGAAVYGVYLKDSTVDNIEANFSKYTINLIDGFGDYSNYAYGFYGQGITSKSLDLRDSSYTISGQTSTALGQLSRGVVLEDSNVDAINVSGSTYKITSTSTNTTPSEYFNYIDATGLNLGSSVITNVDASNSNYILQSSSLANYARIYGVLLINSTVSGLLNLSGSYYDINAKSASNSAEVEGLSILSSSEPMTIGKIDASASTYKIEANGGTGSTINAFNCGPEVNVGVLDLSNSTYDIKSSSNSRAVLLGTRYEDTTVRGKFDTINANNSTYKVDAERESSYASAYGFVAYYIESNEADFSNSTFTISANSSSSAVAYGVGITDSIMQNVNFQNSRFEITKNGVDITDTNAANFSKTTLINADFRGSNISDYCINTAANLQNVIYSDGTLSGLNVNGSNMTILAHSSPTTRARAGGSISAKLTNSSALITDGSLTLENGAVLEVLNGNSFTLGSGGILDIQVDEFSVFTPLMFDGNSTFILDGGVVVIDLTQELTSDRIFSVISWTGGCDMSDLANLLEGSSIVVKYNNKAYKGDWSVSINENRVDVFLAAIPEPAEYAAIMGLLVLVFARYYKRRK